MPAKNEILPLSPSTPVESTAPTGPTRSTIALPVPSAPKGKSVRNDTLNLEATNAQERRIRLVTLQRRQTLFQLFYGLFGIALMIVQMEYLWYANTRDFTTPCAVDPTKPQCPACFESLVNAVPGKNGRMILHALRVLISFSTALLLYYVYAFYTAECEVLKIKNIVPPKATLLSSPLRYQFLFEVLLFAIHPFPGLEGVDPDWPNLMVSLSLLMFARLVLGARVVQFRNSFNSSNGWFIGALTNVDYTLSYFLKSTLKNHPSRSLLACFSTLLFVTGYALFVVERFFCAFIKHACCEPMTFADALWSLVVTILTIGYGDVVPHTSAGRFFAVVAGLCGTGLTAVTIAVMSSYLTLTRSEHKVNAFLKKDENRRLINEHAARAIQAYIQLRAVQRRYHALKSKRGARAMYKAEQKLYDVLSTYRQVKRHVNSHDVSDPMDKQMTMLEMMEVNVEYIRTKIEDLSELFHAQMDKARSKRRLSVPKAVVSTVSGGSGSTDPGGSTGAGNGSTSATNSPRSSVRNGITNISGSNTTANPGTVDGGAHPSTGSSSAMPRAGNVPGQASILENDAPNKSMMSTTASSTASNPTIAPFVSFGSNRGLTTTSVPINSSYNYADVPEWAIMMESTLQTILSQVARVSTDVDVLRMRVQNQMDQLQTRLTDIERRIGVQDALREISRGQTTRRVISSQSSMNHSVNDNSEANGEPGSTNYDATGPHSSGQPSPPLATAARLSRLSFVVRKASIKNFVTSKELKDLEDMQNGTDSALD
ncbi:hypothetical protein Poli38472_003407 [Pythium oligandrum]|uniref:Potassium channel domain-containing protein n=1 Tax=Pythium oligandrum TaxID=41045 RepID=A0A8K1FFB0_PYTOL|nr:hypothetical protein Poli38472_003407 [Pythium oligandrum]|eukprot:TMW57482.1 hypothetical protein Poli38472_003407 [Pythium oligandrum]